MNHQTIALIVFIAAYVFFIFLPQRRSLVAMAAVAVLLLFGVLDPLDAFMHGVNWNVMGIFVGMLVLAEAFMVSRFPAYLAERIVNHAPNTAFAILFICAMTSFLSAFVENVATVLIIAPVALSLAKKLNINPVNMMVAIAISSNLQGCATLIGDPPSMLLGGFAKMTFMDFFFYHGKPGIFFAVQLGAITSILYLYFVFRHHKEKTKLILVETVQSWVPTVLLSLLILTLAVSSFFDKGFSFLAGMICMAFALVTLLWQRSNHKTGIIENVKKLDWDTTFFLMGVFIVVESLTQTGWITKISDFLSNQVGDNLFFGYALLIIMSVIISGFVDNVPYLAAMLPVAIQMSEKLQVNPALLMFGLLIGASLGGNLTPIGASANIVACGILKKEGHIVSFPRFMKISVPFTIVAVLPAAALVWFIWS